MSQFDRENNEVIALVNENHRRSCVCPTIGVIVPVEEAKKIAVQNARAAQGLPSVASVILAHLLSVRRRGGRRGRPGVRFWYG